MTEPVISFERKGQDIVRGRNLVHLMLASNEEWVVPASVDDRRFVVLDVSDKRQGDTQFLRELNEELYQRSGLEAMLYDLAALDLADWH